MTEEGGSSFQASRNSRRTQPDFQDAHKGGGGRVIL